MLKTFFKAIRAKDKQTLAKLSEEVYNNAKQSKPTRYVTKIKPNIFGMVVTKSNAYSLACHASDCFYSYILNEFSFYQLVWMNQIFEKEIRPRAYYSLIIGTFPIKKATDTLLTSVGLPLRYHQVATYGLYAATEVLTIKFSQGFRSRSLFDFAVDTTAVSGLLYLNAALTDLTHKYIWFIPKILISGLYGFAFGTLIHRISLYGVKEAGRYVAESAVTFVFRKYNANTHFLPAEIDIPVPMQCTICRELLNDPIESQGFFFCNKCLKDWMKVGQTNPGNGLPLSEETISKNVTMNLLTIKYRKLVLEEYTREHPNWQTEEEELAEMAN